MRSIAAPAIGSASRNLLDWCRVRVAQQERPGILVALKSNPFASRELWQSAGAAIHQGRGTAVKRTSGARPGEVHAT
jgi:hypothetical protein